MAEPIEKIVDGDGLKINLAIWEGIGKPILCFHGITANCRCWDVMASTLAPEHHLIAMDLRGRGRSEKPLSGYSMAHHIRDIYFVLDSLNLREVMLMGHSLGAFIALTFGVENTDRVDCIILVARAGKLSPAQFDKVFEAIKPALDRLGKIYPSAEVYITP